MIVYNQYTAKDVREWIENGEKGGLLESIISLTRANALIHCPCVNEDDVLVVAASDGDRVVGYTAIFPEKLARPDMWIAIGTTLWVDSNYADEFVGYNLVQRLWNAYPNNAVIGSDVVPAAAMIDKLLGATVLKYERKSFVLRRNIEVHTLRNFASRLLEPFRKYFQRKAIRRVIGSISSDIRVTARDTIDAETYAFIKAHSDSYTFLRSREILNWILRYPFSIENLVISRADKRMEFHDQAVMYRNNLLQIYIADKLIGIVMLSMRGSKMDVKMLYTDDVHCEIVYAVVVEAMIHSHQEQLCSIYPQLNAYITSRHLALRENKQQFIFTFPKSIKVYEPLVLQGIEGDMFV